MQNALPSYISMRGKKQKISPVPDGFSISDIRMFERIKQHHLSLKTVTFGTVETNAKSNRNILSKLIALPNSPILIKN